MKNKTISVLFVVFALFSPLIHSAEIQWGSSTVQLRPQGEPLKEFLLRFFASQQIPAVISEKVGTAPVSGKFTQNPGVLFRALASQYGLSWYYDGAVVYVYSLSEIESKVFWINPGDAGRLTRVLRELRVLDTKFPIRTVSSEGYVSVSGPPRYLELIGNVVSKLETASIQQNGPLITRVFKLKHAWADDTTVTLNGSQTVVPGIAKTLAIMLDEYTGAGRPSGGKERLLSRGANRLSGKGLANIGKPPASPEKMPIGTSSGSSFGSGGLASLSKISNESANQPRDTQDESDATVQLASGGAITTNPRLNAVIVRDTVEKMQIYEQLIAELDQPSPLVEIEASIIDVSTDKSESLGVDWRLNGGSKVDVISSPNRLADRTGSRNDGAANAGNLGYTETPFSAGQGLVATTIIGSQRHFFLARINALAQDGDAMLQSKPRVLTLNNNEALLQNIEEFYVRVPGFQQSDLFNVSTGLLLRVTPSVIEDGQNGRKFRLNIRVEDGSTSRPGTEVDGIPRVSRTIINTQAVVTEGDSLLIGGFTLETRMNGSSGVPGLKNVPILGWLFGQKSAETRRVERVFLITPKLLGAAP